MPVNESTTSAELLSGCSCCEPRALWLGSETRVPFDASSGSHLAFPASFQDLKRLKACSGETSAATRASALRPQPRQAVVRSQEMPRPCWGRVCLLPRAGNDWCPHALSAMRLERRTTACPLMAVVLSLLGMRWILGRWSLGKVGSRAPLLEYGHGHGHVGNNRDAMRWMLLSALHRLSCLVRVILRLTGRQHSDDSSKLRHGTTSL